MNVLFLTPKTGDVLEGFWQNMQIRRPELTVERLTTTAALSKRLRRFGDKPDLILLALPEKEMLCDVLPLEGLLRPHRVVLILPDGDPDTLHLAHRLRPRYVMDFESEWQPLEDVLRRMIERCSPPDEHGP